MRGGGWGLVRGIRRGALRDAAHAFTSGYGYEAGHDERQWRELLRGNLWLLAFEDGMAAPPVGVIAATQETPPPEGEAFLSSLWVDPTHRRRGIARRLLQAAADRVAAQGTEAVSLWVLDGNEAAHRLYAAV